MFNSFYKTQDLDEPLYTQEEFEDTSTKEVTALVRIYNSFHEKFSEKNIQHLAVQDFIKYITRSRKVLWISLAYQ